MNIVFESPLFGKRLEALMKDAGFDVNKKGASTQLAKKMLQENHLEFLVNNDLKKRQDSARSRIDKHRDLDSAENVEGKWLKAYCDYFKCSADYLFGYIDMPKHQQTDINKETGLSKDAIDQLHRLTTFPAGGNRLAIIDYLLCNTDFSTVLTENVIDYYKKYNRFESGKKKYFEEGKMLKALAGDNILKEIELQASGKFTPTIDRHKLADLDSSREASRFRIQKSFDKILDGIDECLYKNNNPENEETK